LHGVTAGAALGGDQHERVLPRPADPSQELYLAMHDGVMAAELRKASPTELEAHVEGQVASGRARGGTAAERGTTVVLGRPR
jgi:hypothetical protein